MGKIWFGDLEANGLLENATKIHCAVFKEIQTKEIVKFTPKNMDKLTDFMDKQDVFIFHNGFGYDFPLIKKIYGKDYTKTKNICDTLVMSRVLNPTRVLPPHCPNRRAGPHSIEAWGYRVGRGKPEYTEWDEYDEEMLHRCTEDVEILSLTYEALMEEARKANWMPAIKLSQTLFKNLQRQEEVGWYVDIEYLNRCIKWLNHWIELIDKVVVPQLPSKIENKGPVNKPFKKNGDYSAMCNSWYEDPKEVGVSGPFSRITHRKTNINSNMEIKDYLLSQGWIPTEWNLDDEGNRRSPKFSKEDTFQGINGKLGKLIARRVQCRQRMSVIEGLKQLVRKDGTIPSSVANLAVTGRAMHRNIVNVPNPGSFFGRQFRKIFSCRPGKILVSCDSAACQIRMLCHYMNDEEYTDVVVNGKKEEATDMHSINQRKAGLPSRNAAKTFFFAYIFGASDRKLGKELGCSETEARTVRNRFDESLPHLVRIKSELTESFRRTGYIEGYDGRPIRASSEHQLLVYLLQSAEAIYMTNVYNNVWNYLDKYFPGAGAVCWYHDEITVECYPEQAEEIKKMMEYAFENTGKEMGFNLPLPGEAKIGHNWYEVH